MKEYIERASLMGALTSGTEQLDMREMTGAEAYAEFVRLVNFAPAADVVEVRHARWIKHEGYDECEACRAKVICRYNYCPNCGARMGKEDEHEIG